MKKIKGKKGAMTLEASILVPILLLMIAMALDSAYLFFLKSAAASQINHILDDANSRIFSMTNEEFSKGFKISESPERRLKSRLKMRITDEMFFHVNTNEIENKIKSVLSEKLSLDKSCISVKADEVKGVFSLSFSVEYRIEFKSLLSKIFKKISPDFVSLSGKRKIKMKNHFTDIVNIEIISDILSENTNIDDFFKKVREGVVKLTSP